MKNLILLLIPFLLFSSCSIDWNQDRGEKFEGYYGDLQNKYPSKKNEILYMKTHGYKEAVNNLCPSGFVPYGMKTINPIIMCIYREKNEIY